MATSRRTFLKTTAIAGATAALKTLPVFAEPTGEGSGDSAASLPEKNAPAAFTRGIGIYPGAPEQDFGPMLVADAENYRNLALLRPAYHSSSYDYNLTAQLVTDGIKDTTPPMWIATSDGYTGSLPKEEREILVDHFPSYTLDLRGMAPTVTIRLGGGDQAPEIDRVDVVVTAPLGVKPESLTFTVAVSEDGRTWNEAGSLRGPKPKPAQGPSFFGPQGDLYESSVPLRSLQRSRYYRVQVATEIPGDSPWRGFFLAWKLGQVSFYHGPKRIEVGGPYNFTSAWMSSGLDEEWVYVDLGTKCEFDHVKLFWIARAADGSVQVSDDAQSWRDLMPLPGGPGKVDDLKLDSPTSGRYVRVVMRRPTSPEGFALSEVEVWGRGGFVAKPKPRPSAADGCLELTGGGWKLQRSSQVVGGGEEIAEPGFDDASWVVATVPGTVLSSYYNVGAVPDPNFGENQLYISDSFFYSDFWYRTEFVSPDVAQGQTAWIEFDGINWKAEVYLNGERLGRIEGGFMRGRFDATHKLLAGKANVLAVRIEKNATPGSVHQKTLRTSGKNGGGLGADDPTYHASAGWDWIPTIRGRNIGIWGSVWVEVKGPVTLEDPLVTTVLPLPDTSTADLTIEFEAVNHLTNAVSGTVRGHFGETRFEQRIALAAAERKIVKFSPATHPQLRIKNPKLWWPAGYGDAYLHDVGIGFEADRGRAVEKLHFKAGLRQMTYKDDNGALKIYVNGRRLISKGGNWGFGESMLRYRGREFDAAVRYHREMNFNMIRNWVGQIGDEAFYEACDRHGVMVWQDFWLANPSDGPDPDDSELFISNTRDLLRRIRRHASVGIYCGRNEGVPPKPIDDGIRKAIAELHPDLHYIPSSAFMTVSGGGPYRAMAPAYYFRTADTKLHSEIGAPTVPPIESLRLMMPEGKLWPQNLVWGLHDFCLESAQSCAGFNAMIDNGLGGARDVEEWAKLAQFVNYETYRAIFEAQSVHRMGALLWMSHPCWPSFVWQTYDYYFEPTAAYFGCKKASEPIHIQWNREKEMIEVVNYSAGNLTGLTAAAEVINMDGSRAAQITATLDSQEDSTDGCIHMKYPAGLSPVHFLRLTLARGTETLSTNFYLRGQVEGDYRALRELPKADIWSETKAEQAGNIWKLTTFLENRSVSPAILVRLKAIREKSGDRILPVLYSDNYIALMPGEHRTIVTEVNEADTRGERPTVVVA